MKRMHVMLQVRDVDASVRFYSTLFDAAPTVRKPDYAKWILDDPRVNLSISDRGAVTNGGAAGVEHLGIQAETAEELAELRRRIGALAGEAAVDDEGETICCYHHSDKLWVTDPQGVSWEAFHTSGEADTYRGTDAARRGDGCCATACCAEAEHAA